MIKSPCLLYKNEVNAGFFIVILCHFIVVLCIGLYRRSRIVDKMNITDKG